jgi:hypothetical protein
MTITVNGVHTAVHAHPMDTASAMAIFKQWTSALQLLSMGSNLNDKDAKRDVRTVARTALTWMQAIKAQAEANEAAAGKAATSAKPTVLRRLQKALKGAVLDMQTFIREVCCASSTACRWPLARVCSAGDGSGGWLGSGRAL